MGAIVNALHGTSLATGIDPLWLARLSIYWEQVWLSCAHSLGQLWVCWLYQILLRQQLQCRSVYGRCLKG